MAGRRLAGTVAAALAVAVLGATAGCGGSTPPAPAAVTTAKLPGVTGGGIRALWQGTPWAWLTVDGTTILGGDGLGRKVHAAAVATGRPLWTAAVPGSLLVLGLVPAGSVVIVAAGRSLPHSPAEALVVTEYIALDLATGKTRWSVPVAGGHSSPPIAASGRFLLTMDPAGAATARLAATGAVAWRAPQPAGCGGPPRDPDGAVLGLAADGPLAVASYDCGQHVVVRRLDAATGRVLWTWRSPAGATGSVQTLAVATAAADGGLILITGEISRPPAGQRFLSRLPRPYQWPTALGPNSGEDMVLALDAATGRPRWSELGGQQETIAPTAGDVCEVVNIGLECRADATGATSVPALLTGKSEGDSPGYAGDGLAGVADGLAAVTESGGARGGVLLRVVRVRGGATAALARLAIGAGSGGSDQDVFAIAAAPLTRTAMLVLVRRTDLPGAPVPPVLALAVPLPGPAA